MNIVLGIVGAIVANLILGLIGVSLGGWIGYLIAGFIGACILIAIARAIKRKGKASRRKADRPFGVDKLIRRRLKRAGCQGAAGISFS